MRYLCQTRVRHFLERDPNFWAHKVAINSILFEIKALKDVQSESHKCTKLYGIFLSYITIFPLKIHVRPGRAVVKKFFDYAQILQVGKMGPNKHFFFHTSYQKIISLSSYSDLKILTKFSTYIPLHEIKLHCELASLAMTYDSFYLY